MRGVTLALGAAVAIWSVVFVSAQPQPAGPQGDPEPGSKAALEELLPESPGRDVVGRVCANECHTASTVAAHTGDRDYWDGIVQEMALQGAQFGADEQEVILSYLETQFPPRIDVNLAPARVLETQLGFTVDEASAIVAHRTTHGPLQSLEALKGISGIDAVKVDRLVRRLLFAGKTGK